MSHCTSYINADGNISKIDASFTNRVQEVIEEMAAGSLRTLLLVYKEVKSTPEDWDEIKNDLIIITMVGIKDPLRDGIPEAVRACHEGGVRVRMVTGDNKKLPLLLLKKLAFLTPTGLKLKEIALSWKEKISENSLEDLSTKELMIKLLEIWKISNKSETNFVSLLDHLQMINILWPLVLRN